MRESVRAREHGSVGAWASAGKTRSRGDAPLRKLNELTGLNGLNKLKDDKGQIGMIPRLKDQIQAQRTFDRRTGELNGRFPVLLV
jgi:hypothetical protein